MKRLFIWRRYLAFFNAKKYKWRKRLYDDWLDNKISESNLQKFLEKSQKEQDYLNQRLEDNQKLIVKEDFEDINVRKWIELI